MSSTERAESVVPPFNGFPWPGDGQRRAAAQALRDEQERRREQKRRIWADLGLPGEPAEPEPISPDDAVSIVLWSLRGQR